MYSVRHNRMLLTGSLTRFLLIVGDTYVISVYNR